MNAETQGKSGKKGQWSNKEPPRPHVNDVSLPGNSARWAGVRQAGETSKDAMQRSGRTVWPDFM